MFVITLSLLYKKGQQYVISRGFDHRTRDTQEVNRAKPEQHGRQIRDRLP